MLAKEFRLRKEKDIEQVRRKGQSFFTKYFILKFLPNNLEKNRYTIVVSTKISKNATKRNKIKRILREDLRLRSKKIVKGFDIMVNVTKGILDNNQNIIERDILIKSLEFALKKSNLWQ